VLGRAVHRYTPPQKGTQAGHALGPLHHNPPVGELRLIAKVRVILHVVFDKQHLLSVCDSPQEVGVACLFPSFYVALKKRKLWHPRSIKDSLLSIDNNIYGKGLA
jgi:hypothetical protein